MGKRSHRAEVLGKVLSNFATLVGWGTVWPEFPREGEDESFREPIVDKSFEAKVINNYYDVLVGGI